MGWFHQARCNLPQGCTRLRRVHGRMMAVKFTAWSRVFQEQVEAPPDSTKTAPPAAAVTGHHRSARPDRTEPGNGGSRAAARVVPSRLMRRP